MNYEEKLNHAVVGLPKSGIRKFFDIAAELDDCISLGVGEPDFVTPWDIRAAAVRSIQEGRTQYTSNAGLLSLREKICEYLDVRFGLSYDPTSEVLVTVGASEAIDLCLRTMLTAGDEVLVPAPSYVSYAPDVTMAGGVPVAVATREEDDFRLTPEALESAITPRTKALILPYPNNPTGAIMPRKAIEALVPVIEKHDLFVVSDEIYAELTYGKERHASVASVGKMRERTLLINGFSKAFAMTGWRLGYVAAPKPIVAQMYKIHQYTIMCAPTFSQVAAEYALAAGLNDDFATVSAMRESYDKRRRYLYSEFNAMGLSCFCPMGAFYVFPCVATTGLTGDEFAEKLLRAERVAVVPGSAFGESGRDYVRCSYATSLAELKTAVSRIKRFVNAVK